MFQNSDRRKVKTLTQNERLMQKYCTAIITELPSMALWSRQKQPLFYLFITRGIHPKLINRSSSLTDGMFYLKSAGCFAHFDHIVRIESVMKKGSSNNSFFKLRLSFISVSKAHSTLTNSDWINLWPQLLLLPPCACLGERRQRSDFRFLVRKRGWFRKHFVHVHWCSLETLSI